MTAGLATLWGTLASCLGVWTFCACGSDPLASPPAEEAPSVSPNLLVHVDRDQAVGEVDPRYLSFTVDTARVARPADQTYDFGRPRLRRMAAELTPAYLRIGGTRADETYYDLSDDPVAEAPTVDPNVLTRAVWDGVCDFAQDLGLEILFTLNAGPGPRGEDGRWMRDNARTLIDYTLSQACPVRVWELGNEINGFAITFGASSVLSGAEYTLDVATARTLLDEVDPASWLAGPASAYWPVWGELLPVLPEFLETGGPLVDLVTWHYYPQQSSKCPVASRAAERETMLDPANLDELDIWAEEVETLAAQYAPQAAVWLGETSHAQCGGEDDLSNRYVTGFWWLDQLGRLARRGQPAVFRQTLSGGAYSLIDDATLVPRPDYFTSVLWKRLMGERVLDVRVEAVAGQAEPGPATTMLRAYAHCARDAAGAVSVAVINLDAEHTAHLSFPELGGSTAQLYLLTAPDLLSAEVWLNGVLLAVDEDGSPPAMVPAESGPVVSVPPRSYGFIVLPDADAAACRR